MKKLLTPLLFIIIVSCDSMYKVKDLAENIDKKEFRNSKIIYNPELYTSKKYVCQFNISDATKDWKDVKINLKKMANENFANAIYIEKYKTNEMFGGKFPKEGVVVKGKFYQVDLNEINYPDNISDKRKIFIFRDELESILTKNFITKLTINGKTQKIKDKTVLEYELDKDQLIFPLKINGKIKELKLTEGDNYFWVSKQIDTAPSHLSGGGISINIPLSRTKGILKIKDSEMGKILVSVLNK